MPHHRSTYPMHYPTINKGTTMHPSKLEGVDAWCDKAVDAVAADPATDAVEAVHKCPYHMSEGHS